MNLLLILLCLPPIYFINCLPEHGIVNNVGNDLTVDCVNQVLTSIYNPGHLILVSGNMVGLHYPIIYYDWAKPLTTFSCIKTDITIIRLDENLEFGKIIQKMSEEQYFNPTAKFVVVSNRLSSELLEVSSKFFLTDIIFIETVNKSSRSIYTYEPYQELNTSFTPTSFKHVTKCRNEDLSKFRLFGNYRAPKSWKNSTLNVIYNVIPPYSQCPTCENGIETDLLDIVSGHLGVKVNFIESEDFQYWGSKMNGNYTSILRKLFQRECDMVLGAFHSKCEEHLDFDMTFTFVRDGLFWLVPRAKRLRGYSKLGLVLNFETYLILLATMIVVPVVCHLLYKKHILNYFFVLYQTLLEVALPQSPVHKLIYAHIVIPFLVLSTVFKGSLIHVLSIDHYDYQIRTLEDIVQSNLTITLDHDIAQYFKNDNPLDKHVYQSYKYCAEPRDCINRTAYERNVVTVDFQRTYEYQLPTFYVDSDGKPLLYLFPTPIFPLYIHWYFVKGFPIFPQIDDILLKLKSTGIVHHLCDKATFKARVDLSRKVGIASNILRLREVGPLFVLISFGHFLGLIAFLVELCTTMNKRKRKA